MLIDSMTDKKKSKSGGKLGSKKPRNPDESSGDDSLLLSMTEDTESSEHEEEKTSKKRRKTEPAGRSKKDKTDKKRKREPSPNSTNKKPRTNGESELYVYLHSFQGLLVLTLQIGKNSKKIKYRRLQKIHRDKSFGHGMRYSFISIKLKRQEKMYWITRNWQRCAIFAKP